VPVARVVGVDRQQLFQSTIRALSRMRTLLERGRSSAAGASGPRGFSDWRTAHKAVCVRFLTRSLRMTAFK
jgi:hypothetical protein